MLTLSKPHLAAPICQDHGLATVEPPYVTAAVDASDSKSLACSWFVDPATGTVCSQWDIRARH